MSGQFVKGQSGNPSGRPTARRPHNSAFDIIFDKTLTVNRGGVEREVTIDEALEMQTYRAALKGNKTAIRTILKMIDKREQAIRKAMPPAPPKRKPFVFIHPADNADEALRLLNITCPNPEMPGPRSSRPLVVETWAAQAAISRPGRKMEQKDRDNLSLFVKEFATLRWPRGQGR